MKSTTSRSTPATPSTRTGRKAGVALRTGKIHASKASATQIRLTVGVKAADERLAARALILAAAKPKTTAAAKSAKTASKR